MAIAQANPSSKTDVFVFWNILFQDAGTPALVKNLRDRGVAVKVIDPVQSDRARYKERGNHFPLYADATLMEAIELLPSAAWVVLPHDIYSLDLVLAQPDFEVFIRNAAENDAQFVAHTELVAQFALDRTTDKSFDWVYPRDGVDIDTFMSDLARKLDGWLN